MKIGKKTNEKKKKLQFFVIFAMRNHTIFRVERTKLFVLRGKRERKLSFRLQVEIFFTSK